MILMDFTSTLYTIVLLYIHFLSRFKNIFVFYYNRCLKFPYDETHELSCCTTSACWIYSDSQDSYISYSDDFSGKCFVMLEIDVLQTFLIKFDEITEQYTSAHDLLQIEEII